MRKRKKLRVLLLVAAALILLSPLTARIWVHLSARGRVFDNPNSVPKCRTALVLGARVYPDGRLSTLLRIRVEKAIELYKLGKVEKILMSGDNRFAHYNEPRHMRDYAISRGVPPEDIVMDFAGRRTYDSVYRTKYIFGQEKFIIVSQGFHVDRAVFLCNHLGIESYGVTADTYTNAKALIREMPACLAAMADVYVRRPTPIMGKKEKI